MTHRSAGTSTVLETRTRDLSDIDARVIRAADDATPQRFVGHAAVFNSRTAIGNPLSWWGWYEEVADGAFDKTLGEGDARFLVDHDTRMLVARVSAGDLRLNTDDIGLAVDADLDDELSYVRDLARNLEKRRVTGMSFGFYVVRDEWSTIEVEAEVGGSTDVVQVDLRRLTELRLLEVSAVTFPAYDATDAGLRAMTDEVRAARNRPARPDPSAAPDGGTSAPEDPAGSSTRRKDPAPPAGTRGVTALDRRARELAARYSLTLPPKEN
ncbi:HK97 family phage prohead protease [Kineococcus gynurae]|uniref:HK97 family phage prohead protease n=1 Tax=Kineococcus gynurae TaxID=452979 RepID=A0ABV5LWX3_9ACTN